VKGVKKIANCTISNHHILTTTLSVQPNDLSCSDELLDVGLTLALMCMYLWSYILPVLFSWQFTCRSVLGSNGFQQLRSSNRRKTLLNGN